MPDTRDLVLVPDLRTLDLVSCGYRSMSRSVKGLRFYHICKLTSYPVSWMQAEDMRLLGQR